jgi:predicted RNase H-like nuclease (RuvC/YqgF family)
MDYTANTLSTANQVINDLREKVNCMESEIAHLKKMVAEETSMRYDLYQRLVQVKKESKSSF